jgi:hypothetical protein
MRTKIIAQTFLSIASSAHAQQVTPILGQWESHRCDSVYHHRDVDSVPTYLSGEAGLFKDITTDLPSITIDTTETIPPGTTYIEFVIDSTGHARNGIMFKGDVLLARSIYKKISDRPRWQPGMKNGKPVCVLYVLPVKVCLR